MAIRKIKEDLEAQIEERQRQEDRAPTTLQERAAEVRRAQSDEQQGRTAGPASSKII
ncbi:MAG: hypothetical protein LBJ69_03100 [Holosporales bacterium]|nr:hypothetical protein [Holosporales bacterium]